MDEKNKFISEYKLKGFTEDIQKMTDNYIKEVETHCKTKEKEIIEI